MQGDIQIFAASLGTTGSLIGNITSLKEKNPNIISLGIIRKANNPVPGPRTKALLQHIAFPREQQVDHLIEVGSKESYLQSLHLLRSGILV
jgi:cysteine synthase A